MRVFTSLVYFLIGIFILIKQPLGQNHCIMTGFVAKRKSYVWSNNTICARDKLIKDTPIFIFHVTRGY